MIYYQNGKRVYALDEHTGIFIEYMGEEWDFSTIDFEQAKQNKYFKPISKNKAITLANDGAQRFVNLVCEEYNFFE